jgi:hypothetical protein
LSTAVYVYSVPVGRLRAVPGSKDKRLLAAARKPKLKGFFQTIDEIAEDRDEEEKPPRCEEAFRQIINGDASDERFGYVYGYAYEAICLALGAEAEPSWTQIAGFFEWFEEIDNALALLGIKLKVADLFYRGPLIEIPRPNDFPGLGHWTVEEVAEAAGAFRTIDLKELDAKSARKIRRAFDAVEDVRSWIKVASERPGDWLIGVHS